jgi:hypothetical protein
VADNKLWTDSGVATVTVAMVRVSSAVTKVVTVTVVFVTVVTVDSVVKWCDCGDSGGVVTVAQWTEQW